jgi:hypothetical protein
MEKSVNYYVVVVAVEHPVLKSASWVWRVHHTMTKDPILQSPLFSQESEAKRLAQKFSEEFGIRFISSVEAPAPKRFKIIHGGLDEDKGPVL